MNTLKLNLKFPADLHTAALRLQDILGFEIAEKLAPSYRSGDKDTLQNIARSCSRC